MYTLVRGICAERTESHTQHASPNAHDLRARIRAALLLDLPVFWFPRRANLQFASRARVLARICEKMCDARGLSLFLGTRKIAQFRRHAKMGLTVLQFGGLAACASWSANNIYASGKAASSGSLLERNFVYLLAKLFRERQACICVCVHLVCVSTRQVFD
jgi:hypothetical protein